MKKLILTLGVCGVLFTAPSCQKEDVDPQVQTEYTLKKSDCCGEEGTDPSNPNGSD